MNREEKIAFAKNFLSDEKIMLELSNARPAILVHNGMHMIGSVSSLIPEAPEIVLCAHTSFFVDKELADIIKELNPERLELTIDPELTTAQRQDVFNLVGNILTKLSNEQAILADNEIKARGIVEI